MAPPLPSSQSLFDRAQVQDFRVSKPKFFHHSQVPELLRLPYIQSGYRFGKDHVSKWSLFELHNDTLNVWTHLVGFLYVIWITPQLFQELPANSSWFDFVFFGQYILSVLLCLGFSTAYHLFRAESEEAYNFWYRLDISGICILIASSFTVSTWIAFHDQLYYFFLYNSIVFFGLGIALVLTNHPKFYGMEYEKWRSLILAGVTSYGVIPLSHWVGEFETKYMNGENLLNIDVPSVRIPPILMLGFYGLGFIVFYFLKFPECFWPGKFDKYAASHQLWHICVLIAALSWLYGMHDHLSFMSTLTTTVG